MFEDIVSEVGVHGCEAVYTPEGVDQKVTVYFVHTDILGHDYLQLLTRAWSNWVTGRPLWDNACNSELERATQHLPTYLETV